jgi:N-ethylmaleimide reductase
MGWPFGPGIWTEEQVEGWKAVTDAVHGESGHIILQLWRMGRMVHPDFLGGEAPVSSSATTGPGAAHTYVGKQPCTQSRPLEIGEIPGIVDDYRRAASNAMKAGFDGVQLYAANGYLIDQFLRDSCNQRDDDYGGPPENRVRLLAEVTQAVVGEVGSGRTAVRLSPNGLSQGAIDSDPETLFAYAARVLDAIGIAFLELRNPGADSSFRSGGDQSPVAPVIRHDYRGLLVLNSDYDRDRAGADLASGRADAISFGRSFLANPDLPDRLRLEMPLNSWDEATWYGPGERGYTDYTTIDATVLNA